MNQIDLIKLDIEGAEFEILLDFDIQDKIKTLFFEYHILNKQMLHKFKLLIEKLNIFYKTIQQKPSIYNDKIGYILAYN